MTSAEFIREVTGFEPLPWQVQWFDAITGDQPYVLRAPRLAGRTMVLEAALEFTRRVMSGDQVAVGGQTAPGGSCPDPARDATLAQD